MENFLDDPTDIRGWIPGWEVHICPAAQEATDFVCAELGAEAYAIADAWESTDETPMNECKPMAVPNYINTDSMTQSQQNQLATSAVEEYGIKMRSLLEPVIRQTSDAAGNETNQAIAYAILHVATESLIESSQENLAEKLESNMKVYSQPT